MGNAMAVREGLRSRLSGSGNTDNGRQHFARMWRFDPFWTFPAVAHYPVKHAPFRQAALARGFAPVADSNTEHTDLFALGDDLGFGPRSWLLLVLAVIRLAHVHVNMMRWFHRKRKAP